MRILIIEDSKRLLETLEDGLTRLGYGVDAVDNGHDGLEYARFSDYDVIILDLMLPGLDGLSVLQKLRACGKQTHVLILSAKDQVEDRIRGLQLGADDYMIKPFSFDEFCARVSALVRRKYDAKIPVIEIGGLTVNTAVREVWREETAILLTPSEYAILEFLILNRGRVVTNNQLIDAVYDSEASPGTNVIQVMVCNLRRKLRSAGDADIIKTRRGSGYFIE